MGSINLLTPIQVLSEDVTPATVQPVRRKPSFVPCPICHGRGRMLDNSADCWYCLGDKGVRVAPVTIGAALPEHLGDWSDADR